MRLKLSDSGLRSRYTGSPFYVALGALASEPTFQISAQERVPGLAGGGSVTFGAPMVVYSNDARAAYRQLEDLEQFAEANCVDGAKLEFHNFVNNADIVPRLLGTSLDSVHEAMEGYIPSMKVHSLIMHIQGSGFCLSWRPPCAYSMINSPLQSPAWNCGKVKASRQVNYAHLRSRM